MTDDLDAAERELAELTDKTSGLAAMGSLELHAAVAGGTLPHAVALMRYRAGLYDANFARHLAWDNVARIRAKRGLDMPGRFSMIPPDFGPMPHPAPGEQIITGKEAQWVRLLGSLNGRDAQHVADCLRELGGWVYRP